MKRVLTHALIILALAILPGCGLFDSNGDDHFPEGDATVVTDNDGREPIGPHGDRGRER